MIIKKSLMRFKVSILLFSFSLCVFVLAFAKIADGKLRSGGQLSLSVDSSAPNTKDAHQLNRPNILASNSHSNVSDDVVNSKLALKKHYGAVDKKISSNNLKTLGENIQSHVDLDEPQVKKDEDEASHKKEAKPRDEEKVIFNFEDVDLANVAAYVERLFDVTFISDESINPIVKGGQRLSGNKVSFKTQKPLTKKQAWNVFVTFLDMAGLYLIPQANPKMYRISIADKARRSAIKTFINVDPETLPDSDTIVRYGYFVKDCPLDTIQKVLETLRSRVGQILILQDHSAFIITDSAYNIKVLMKVVKELDKVTMPQTMSVLRLHKVEAKEAKILYEKLTKDEQEGTVAARLFGAKKPSRALYFPKNARVIDEGRTNSLIIFGDADAVKKIEEFFTKYVDIDSPAPYSPLFIYDLKYADAVNVQNIMTNLVRFGQEGDRKMVGAIRGGDKYFKKMSFTAEPENNRLIIRGNYDDYKKIKKILDEIDSPPVQVAMEILILGIEIEDRRDLGVQLRNKFTSPDGQRFNFQTSGISMGSPGQGIIQNTDKNASGALRLLGDLIDLVTGASAGTTAISLGSDKLGVWGIFGILNNIANTQVVANPFLTATNNSKARVKLGETKRVQSSIVQTGGDSTTSFQNLDANIEVTVRPTVNSDGMIVMEIEVTFDTFIGDTENRTTRTIKTTVVSANNEILALGGLLRDREEDNLKKVPVLGNIPILGWLFKNKFKQKTKEDLLVLVTAHIVEPGEDVKQFTKRHIKEYKDALQVIEDDTSSNRDPVDRAFFKDVESKYNIEDYIFTRGRKKKFEVVANDTGDKSKSKKRRRKRRKKRQAKSKNSTQDNQSKKTQKNKNKNKNKKRKRRRRRNKKVENATLVV